MDPRLLYFLAFTLVLLVSTFYLIFYLAGAFGWDQLAKVYRCQTPFTGKRWWGQDLTFGTWLNYSGCVTVGANGEGLYLGFPPRVGHPPLLIPWSDLHLVWQEEKLLGWTLRLAEITTTQVPGVRFRLRERTVKRIGEELGHAAWATGTEEKAAADS